MDNKQLINILNNQSGIIQKDVTEEEYNSISVGDIIPFYSDFMAQVLSKYHYPDYEGCKWAIRIKILAEISINKIETLTITK